MTTPRRAVAFLVVGQTLYTLGSAVSSGTVFRYFIDDWPLPAVAMTLVLVMPETVQTLAVAAGGVIQRAGSAKATWLLGAVVGRLAATAAAAIAFLDPSRSTVGVAYGMLALQALSEAAQAISYVALMVWLSRIYGPERWGKTFAIRRIGVVAGMLLLPAALAAYGRTRAEGAADLLAGNGVAAVGIAILALITTDRAGGRDPSGRREGLTQPRLAERLQRLLATPRAIGLIATSWHLAAAQGLTQFVFFRYAVDALDVDAAQKASLVAFMFAVQLPLALVAGRLVDRFDGRVVLTAGIWVTAAAVPCWLLADRSIGWLWLAYGLWGGFSLVNVALQTLSLQLASPEDRAESVAVVRFGAGVVAAVTPLAVAGWLPDGAAMAFSEDPFSPWVIVMGVSFLGRMTAPLWLWISVQTDRGRPSDLAAAD